MSIARQLANLGGQSLATDSEISTKIDSNGSVTDIVELTQAEYDALTPDSTTLYVIVG